MYYNYKRHSVGLKWILVWLCEICMSLQKFELNYEITVSIYYTVITLNTQKTLDILHAFY